MYIPKSKPLSGKGLDQIDGLMLGDASIIYANTRKTSGKLQTACMHREPMVWLTQEVESFKNRPVWEAHIKDTRTGVISERHWIRSLATIELAEQRERWYPHGKKELPADVRLNRTSLLHWYIDDGGVVSNTHGTRKHLPRYLATDDFPLHAVEFLCDLIQQETTIETTPHRNGKNWRIYVPARYADTFLDFIGPSPLMCYDYKWCR